MILKKLNIIDPQMNTTKLVIMTLPNYHKREFKIHWKKFPTFHNPSVHQNLLFSPFEPSLEVMTHYTECTRVKHIQPSNTPTCTLQLSCNTTKETHLSSCAQCFHFMAPQNDPNFHLTMLHKNPIRFYKLGIYPEQIAGSITNHLNITLK